MPKENILKIKDYSRDRLVESVAELRKTLSGEYRGQHVSIVYSTKPHGLRQVVFVTVADNGVVRETYRSQDLINFAEIELLTA